MPHVEVIWTEGPDGNSEHLAEHGISPEEAEEVLRDPTFTGESRRSGRPIVIGTTRSGKKILVVYDILDRLTVFPITAYEVD